METIKENTIGQCWLSCIDHVCKNSELVYDEDVGIHEVLGLSVKIDNPMLYDEIVNLHGDQTVIEHTAAKFDKGASMPDRPFTYGERIYDLHGVNQFEWIVHRLNSKPETKSATISFLLPGDQSANLPCLTTIDAKIRQDRLEVQFFFRSQNIFGRQYANLLALSKFQHSLAERCAVDVGALQGYIASAHIYDFDFTQAKRLCMGEMIKITDQYYAKGPKSIRQRIMRGAVNEKSTFEPLHESNN